MKMALSEVERLFKLPPMGEDAVVTGWSIDSRTTAPGDLFFALPGDRHDGHDYVGAALAKGALAAVVERPTGENRTLQVADSEQALQLLAAHIREWWDGTVIGITGSAGKTTTKEIVATLVSVDHPTGKTIGNLNNHLGVPLSLLRLADDARYAVLEMGMNHAGEIQALCQIARPQIGIVTNVGYAHIENFDSIEGIAAAKRELIEALPASGLAILNYDDLRVREFSSPGRRIRFGVGDGADLQGKLLDTGIETLTFQVEDVVFHSHLTGRHSLSNLLAGLAVARELGAKLEHLRDAVASLRPAKMRGERLQVDGITILDDCYNSNPAAARAMLDVLGQTPAQRRIAVLGEMLELGPWAEELHRDVGKYAATNGVTVLLGIRGAAWHLIDAGRASGLDAGAALFFESPEEAGAHLRSFAKAGDAILFKGSRGTHVEIAMTRFLEGR